MNHDERADARFLGLLRETAEKLAREAGQVTLEHFGGVLRADAKADGTPVTVADRAAEEVLRQGIRERFPGHTIVGEEFGEDAGTDDIRWILDPIDGTQSFMRGVPLYAVLIGVELRGIPAVGVAAFPALGEMVSAAAGLGARWWRSGATSPSPARVSHLRTTSEAAILTTDLRRILEDPLRAGWQHLSGQARIVRGWGDAWGHALVATGRAEVMIDPVLELWDAAPLLPILREAGGRFTDLNGRETIHGRSGVSTNGHLHEAVLEALSLPPG